MKHQRAFILLMLCTALTITRAQSVFPVRDSSYGEARSRSYHVMHYKIEVSFDEQKKSVSGRTTITLVPFMPNLSSVSLDAEQLNISRVTLEDKPLQFSVKPKMLDVALDRGYSYRDTLTLSIDYTCTPRKGLYFIQPDSTTPDKPWQIWTQGEDMDNHFWFPCYDFPNDKATSEVIATVRDAYVVLSNGRLASVTEDKAHATKTYHWKQDLPHSSYLIMLAAGAYTVLHDTAGTVPLEYYVYPDRAADAKASFAETPAIMKFFSMRTGFPYPWAKYAQVAIADFMYGGMENTSATTLIDDGVQLDARTRVDQNAVSLIAHEMAHQWWGDVVTCKDWRHLWLNEGFASYFDPLYFEWSRGRDEFDFHMYQDQQSAINTDRSLGRKPIVSVGSYSSNVYSRGADVLHMLRHVLGDSLFFRALHHYIGKNKFAPVETNDLKNAIEESTGQNLYWFFDEWLYKAGHPVFDVSYRWNDTLKAVLMSVRQTQQQDSLTGVFRVPVDIEITTRSGSATYPVALYSADTMLSFPCREKPSLVIFDKGNWTLKELRFEKSRDEWKYQAEHATNPIDRLLAIQTLDVGRDSADVIPLYCALATHDPFHAVRERAIQALGNARASTPALQREITAAVAKAGKDVDPAVRAASIQDLGELRDIGVRREILDAFGDSSNAVLSQALGALARVDSARAADTIASYLHFPSHRNVVANAALSALAMVDSTRALEAAFTMIGPGHHPWTRWAALHLLRGYSSIRPRLVQTLTGFLQDRNAFIRSTSIRFLGEYGSASLIPALEAIAADKENPSAQAAEDAVKHLRSMEHHG